MGTRFGDSISFVTSKMVVNKRGQDLLPYQQYPSKQDVHWNKTGKETYHRVID